MPILHGKPLPHEPTSTADQVNRHDTKRNSEYYDPCAEASSRSLRCIHRNGGDRTLCADFFQAYKDCRVEWQERMREEKRLQRLRAAERPWFGGFFGGEVKVKEAEAEGAVDGKGKGGWNG